MPDGVIRPPYPLRVKVSIMDRDPDDRGIVRVLWSKARRKKATLIFNNREQLEDALRMSKRMMDRKIFLFDFSGQDLRGADFSRLMLNGCRFRDCNLDGADFTHSWLMGTDFSRASMRGAKLSRSFASTKLRVYPCGPHSPRRNDPQYPFDYFHFGPTRFRGTDLGNADLTRTRLINGAFRGTNLAGAKLDGAHFGRSHFFCVNMSGAQMKGTVIKRSVFHDSPLSQDQLRQSVGPALSLSHHGADRLRRMRRRKAAAIAGGPR